MGTPEWPLPGTLTVPTGSGPFPAVLLVHGSGPNDRDETVGPNKPFRDLAWGLASQGIVALRYEKRTRVYGRDMPLQKVTVDDEVVDDAVAGVAVLGERPEVDATRVYVLGHSLGGWLAPKIAERAPELAGLIILAGSARPLEDVYLDQVRRLFAGSPSARLIETVEGEVARVKDPTLSGATPAVELPLGVPASYWLSLRGYDAIAVARSVPQRLLILHGARDYQVTETDCELWREELDGLPQATLRCYPALNHLFMEGIGPSSPDEYGRPGHVADGVVKDIACWIGNSASHLPGAYE